METKILSCINLLLSGLSISFYVDEHGNFYHFPYLIGMSVVSFGLSMQLSIKAILGDKK